MKLNFFILLAAAAVAQLLPAPARLMPTTSLNMTNITSVHLAKGAVQMMQDYGLWVPNVTNLTDVATSFNGNFTQLGLYLNSVVNMVEEVEKYDASGLDMNQLFSTTPRNGSSKDNSIKDPPNGYGVDCGHCHMCEEACIATIWFPPFLWLCEGLCQMQSWCYHCD